MDDNVKEEDEIVYDSDIIVNVDYHSFWRNNSIANLE